MPKALKPPKPKVTNADLPLRQRFPIPYAAEILPVSSGVFFCSGVGGSGDVAWSALGGVGDGVRCWGASIASNEEGLRVYLFAGWLDRFRGIGATWTQWHFC